MVIIAQVDKGRIKRATQAIRSDMKLLISLGYDLSIGFIHHICTHLVIIMKHQVVRCHKVILWNFLYMLQAAKSRYIAESLLECFVVDYTIVKESFALLGEIHNFNNAWSFKKNIQNIEIIFIVKMNPFHK